MIDMSLAKRKEQISKPNRIHNSFGLTPQYHVTACFMEDKYI